MNSRPGSLAALLGYDPALLNTVSVAHRQQLDALSQAWLVSCIVLAAPAGLAIWLVEHSLPLCLLMTAGVFILVLNLLRLIHAGGGTAVQLPFPKDYRPSLLPIVLLLGLALMMAQPAQLVRSSDQHRSEVEQHRSALVASHLASQAALRGTSKELENDDDFLSEMQECEFIVLRLRLLWSSPRSAVLWTALFSGLVLLPAALAHVCWSKAVFAYERARYLRAAQSFHADERRVEQKVTAILEQFVTYRPPWPFPLSPPLDGAQGSPADKSRQTPGAVT